MAVEWRAYLPVQDTYETNLLDTYVRDGYDRFARKADIKLDDPEGNLRARYTRGTPVRLQVDDGTGFETRWSGFVVDPETSNNQLNVELYGHDLWLRKRNVLTDYDEKTIREILKDLVTRLTPLKWNPDLVDVGDNQTLSINYKGQQLDEVINELASYSTGEYFGANNNREFFFRPTAVEQAPRDFPRGSYIEAKFNEDGTREVNQVTVYYNDGNDAITVDDRDAQNELQESLNSDENVILDVTRSFPEVTSEENARRKANAILDGRATVRTGTLTTWEGFGVEPGQETYVEVPEQSVDREMRVAQVEYWYLDDETKVTVAAGGADDIVDTLVDMSDVVERVEAQSANADANLSRYISQELPFDVDFSLTAKKRTVPDDQLVLGAQKGNLGDTGVGGGFLGDQAADWQSVDVRMGSYRTGTTYTSPIQSSATRTLVERILAENTWDTFTTKQGVQAETWLQGTDKLQMYPDVGDHYWHLNGGDYSDVGSDATSLNLSPSGTVTDVGDGIFGKDAVSMDGNGYLVGSGTGTGQESNITAWVWFRGLPSSGSNTLIKSDGTNNGDRIQMFIDSDGNVNAYAVGASGDESIFAGAQPNPAPDSEWNLAVFRWTGSNAEAEVLVNGTSNSDSVTVFSSFDIKTFDTWALGGDPDGGDVYNGDIAVAGVEYTRLSDETIDMMATNSPAEYTSETLSHGSDVQPTVKLDADMPSPVEATVAVIGSPGTASEERHENLFTSSGSFTPNWSTSHSDFRLEVLPNTSDKTVTPTVNEMVLKA